MSHADITLPFDLRLLRYFVVVAEELHFGRAAARLGIAQPPLSQQIKRLEAMTGVQLFERTSRRVALTEAGAVLLDATRRAFRELGHGLAGAQALASGQRGRLAVGYVALAMTLFLPPLIRRFRADYPGVQLTLHGEATSLQLAALESGTLDAAFATDLVEGDSLVLHAQWRDRLILVQPKGRPASGVDDQLVMFPRHQAPVLYDKIMEVARSLGRGTSVVQEAESWYSIGSLVASGLGTTIAPESVRRYGIPGLQYKVLPRRSPTTAVSLATRREPLTPHLRAFVDHARTQAHSVSRHGPIPE